MIYIDRYSLIQSATPEDVFAILSNPEGFVQMLPRLRKAEFQQMQDGTTHLYLCLAIGGLFGTLCFDGDLSWIAPQEVIFRAHTSLKGEIRWVLEPTTNGTNLRVMARLDLAPMLGPMIHIVPKNRIEQRIGSEFEQSLHELSAQFQHRS